MPSPATKYPDITALNEKMLADAIASTREHIKTLSPAEVELFSDRLQYAIRRLGRLRKKRRNRDMAIFAAASQRPFSVGRPPAGWND